MSEKDVTDRPMLWSGRFKAGPDPEMLALSSSVEVDLALLEQDAIATKAHARALLDAGLLAAADLKPIDACLDGLTERWRGGEVRPAASDEDVHTLVERTLTEELGDLGARIHAGRSRNDLVATDLRLWCKDACDELRAALTELVEALSARAKEHVDTVMPGFTHLQPGVPVSVAFHLLAHGFAFARDARRLEAARAAADVSALGAGALAGTTLPLDPRVAQRELGFASLFDNAMDAVADRDFVADLVYACATTCVHLSRIAEEMVIWATPQFGFARPSEAWSTGSSMMPNKRNPDMAELVRGRAAGAIGDLTGLLSLLKGLPLAYDRDLQEDKLYVFGAVERTAGCLRAMTGLVSGLVFDEARLAEGAASAGTWATDVAELLVARGVPFREAHASAGRLVAAVEAEGGGLDAVKLAAHHDLLTEADFERLAPRASVAARRSHGGTAPQRVREQIERLRLEISR